MTGQMSARVGNRIRVHRVGDRGSGAQLWLTEIHRDRWRIAGLWATWALAQAHADLIARGKTMP